jgi:hypothetical protein
MISVVICSVDPDLLSAIKQNIAETIGVEYEIIAVDNRNSGEGICHVYNSCAKKAKYEYICFVHEDVLFDSQDWGKILIEKSIDDCGVVGIAGGMVRTMRPVSWNDSGKEYARYNIYQQDKNKKRLYYENPENISFSEVLVLDGVFLFVRKQIWEQHPFDEKTFRHFHLYDQDFCFQVACSGYKNYVCNSIKLIHFSRGSFNLNWLEGALSFCEKWKQELPKSVCELTERDWKKIDARELYVYIRRYLIKPRADKEVIKKYLKEFRQQYPYDLRIITLYIKYFIRPFRKY